MTHRNRWFTWVYLLQMVIFHGELLVITRWYAEKKLSVRIFESLRLEKDGNSTGTTPFSRIWMVKPWWNREDVSNPLTNGMVIPTVFFQGLAMFGVSRSRIPIFFVIKGSFRCLFEKIASILGTVMDLGIWGWIRMGYIWRIHQSQWDVIYKWLTIPLPQLWQE